MHPACQSVLAPSRAKQQSATDRATEQLQLVHFLTTSLAFPCISTFQRKVSNVPIRISWVAHHTFLYGEMNTYLTTSN